MNKYIKTFTVTIVAVLLCIFVITPLVGATFNQNTSKATIVNSVEDTNIHGASVEEVTTSKLEISETVAPIPAANVKSGSTCGGSWFKISNFPNSINLDVSPVNEWNAASNPTIVSETENNKNTVIIGHNRCKYGDCLRPFGQFAEIINTKTSDTGEICINGEYYTGNVIYSGPVSQYDVHIMGDWMNKDIVTLFTCYGNCIDQNCNSTDQRYTIAFEKNKV